MTRTTQRPSITEPTGSARRTSSGSALLAAVAAQVVLLPITLGTVAVLREYYDIPTFSWPVITSYASWTLAVIALIVTAHRRPIATPVIPVANAVLLACVATFGINVLGWHA